MIQRRELSRMLEFSNGFLFRGGVLRFGNDAFSNASFCTEGPNVKHSVAEEKDVEESTLRILQRSLL